LTNKTEFWDLQKPFSLRSLRLEPVEANRKGLFALLELDLTKTVANERLHVQEILENEKSPTNSLLCRDAGFVDFPLSHSSKETTADFLVRAEAHTTR
jgi:hypothetical protein